MESGGDKLLFEQELEKVEDLEELLLKIYRKRDQGWLELRV